jgi:nucleotidyltransferase AbiEii toxin of type IV toxin-antitoxin system
MLTDYLHNRKDFESLLNITAETQGIVAGLVEKDYWIMQVLYGLKNQGFIFELKGGTSLSKGYKIIERFSEDIDIHIKPDAKFGINENPKNNKPNNIEARKKFYDFLAAEIKIDGIVSIERDHDFDDKKYRSGGIRLHYASLSDSVKGLKDGILLEAGFDTVAPNTDLLLSSWAFAQATETPEIEFIDNRAVEIACYDPGYTFVEKLQTIATKYRQEQIESKNVPNFMRQYYDVYCLLKNQGVQQFIGTPDYNAHKAKRFPTADLQVPIAENEAFLLSNVEVRKAFKKRYEETAALYYRGQPPFDELLSRIQEYLQIL